MEIPGLGEVHPDPRFERYYRSEPISIPLFSGKKCIVALKDYHFDPKKQEFHTAIENFLTADPSVLDDATHDLYLYYRDMSENYEEDGNSPIQEKDVWNHIRFGRPPVFRRRNQGDKGIYVSVECDCDWEEEHGLQIVLRNGLKINKLGPFDSHLTNADAFGSDRYENVIYRKRSR